jgi:hypothetical protein
LRGFQCHETSKVPFTATLSVGKKLTIFF